MLVESFHFLKKYRKELSNPKYIAIVETAKMMILEIAPALAN